MSSVVRIAAVSDVHYAKTSQGSLAPLFATIAEQADILVIPGDLTDYGLVEEARALVKDLNSSVRIPIVAVLGNHDYESDQVDDLKEVFTGAGVHLLDGDAVEVLGVGFAGIKGFAGGFGRGALGPWGEPSIKAFVQETVQEALKLESALARLTTEHKVAVLHYAPIRETVEGEPPEIFPWLGSSRLEEPLTRFEVKAVFHGHAHKGAPEGKTSTGIPVYNVSLAVLKTNYPDKPPFRLFEIDTAPLSENSTSGLMAVDKGNPGRRATDRAELAR
jgi:Predicted phosphoesterases, related to the Icc protein